MTLFVIRICACTIASCVLIVGNAALPAVAEPSQTLPQVRGLLSKLPLWFESNGGQTASEVEFLARGPGYGLFLAPSGITLLLSPPIADGEESTTANEVDPHTAVPAAVPGPPISVRLKLLNAQVAPRLVGREPLPSKSHYLTGKDPAGWRTNISHFGKVAYEAVYPGVDLVFYGNQRQLEFDFVVSPGADPSPIRMTFEGATSLRLDESGSLVLTAGQGNVLFHKPRVFQDVGGQQISIVGDFLLGSDDTVRFALGPYDRQRQLIIDPVVSLSTYVGGDPAGVAVDNNGNVYVASTTFVANLLTTPGALQPQKAPGTYDVFVMKFDPNSSSVLYATYLGGSGTNDVIPSGADLTTGIAVD